MSVHLRLEGGWAECLTEATCELPMHVPMSLEEAGQLPEAVIWQLAEAFDPPTAELPDGTRYWSVESLGDQYFGALHRDFGLPALIRRQGTVEWWHMGARHRADGLPAVVYGNGTGMEWWERGYRHRAGNQPALILADGHREWWVAGSRERSDGGPTRVLHDGTQQWLRGWQANFNGDYAPLQQLSFNLMNWEADRVEELHREDDLPAVLYHYGTQVWYQHGMIHRDGHRPAIIYRNGDVAYWRRGKQYRRLRSWLENITRRYARTHTQPGM